MKKLLELVEQMDHEVNHEGGMDSTQLAGLIGQALGLGLLELVKKAAREQEAGKWVAP